MPHDKAIPPTEKDAQIRALTEALQRLIYAHDFGGPQDWDDAMGQVGALLDNLPDPDRS